MRDRVQQTLAVMLQTFTVGELLDMTTSLMMTIDANEELRRRVPARMKRGFEELVRVLKDPTVGQVRDESIVPIQIPD